MCDSQAESRAAELKPHASEIMAKRWDVTFPRQSADDGWGEVALPQVLPRWRATLVLRQRLRAAEAALAAAQQRQRAGGGSAPAGGALRLRSS